MGFFDVVTNGNVTKLMSFFFLLWHNNESVNNNTQFDKMDVTVEEEFGSKNWMQEHIRRSNRCCLWFLNLPPIEKLGIIYFLNLGYEIRVTCLS